MKSETTIKPWGSFVQFTKDELSTVKFLYVNKGEELSLQYHNHREEFWRVVKGNPALTINEEVYVATEGDEYVIPAKTKHRISAPDNDVIILEISTGQFDENDIVRLEDKYNRI